jgi:hypothetical protein
LLDNCFWELEYHNFEFIKSGRKVPSSSKIFVLGQLYRMYCGIRPFLEPRSNQFGDFYFESFASFGQNLEKRKNGKDIFQTVY